jgi:hypothetical protein
MNGYRKKLLLSSNYCRLARVTSSIPITSELGKELKRQLEKTVHQATVNRQLNKHGWKKGR